MFFCFTAVVLMAASPYIVVEEVNKGVSLDAEKEIPYGIESESLANTLGCLMIFAYAIIEGLVVVKVRMMQAVPWSVITFTYSLVGVITFSITYLCSADSKARLINYTPT